MLPRKPADFARYALLFIAAGLMVVFYQFPHLWAEVLYAPESARSIMNPELKTYYFGNLTAGASGA